MRGDEYEDAYHCERERPPRRKTVEHNGTEQIEINTSTVVWKDEIEKSSHAKHGEIDPHDR